MDMRTFGELVPLGLDSIQISQLQVLVVIGDFPVIYHLLSQLDFVIIRDGDLEVIIQHAQFLLLPHINVLSDLVDYALLEVFFMEGVAE